VGRKALPYIVYHLHDPSIYVYHLWEKRLVENTYPIWKVGSPRITPPPSKSVMC
jgi:hypothetical protein